MRRSPSIIGQPVDDVAERVVNRLERILGMAVAFGLAEADVGQFALDDIGKAGVGKSGIPRRGGVAGALGQRGKARMLVFEVAQDVLQAVLDPPEIAE